MDETGPNMSEVGPSMGDKGPTMVQEEPRMGEEGPYFWMGQEGPFFGLQHRWYLEYNVQEGGNVADVGPSCWTPSPTPPSPPSFVCSL